MRLDIGMVARYDGKLVKVVSIAEGRTIGLRFLEEKPCPCCGHVATVDLLEHAPLLQDRLEAVETVSVR